MVKNPFGHTQQEHKDTSNPHKQKMGGWLKREDDGISHGKSSLFFIAHDTPLPPAATCIQGHEVLPGESACAHGHPVG